MFARLHWERGFWHNWQWDDTWSCKAIRVLYSITFFLHKLNICSLAVIVIFPKCRCSSAASLVRQASNASTLVDWILFQSLDDWGLFQFQLWGYHFKTAFLGRIDINSLEGATMVRFQTKTEVHHCNHSNQCTRGECTRGTIPWCH